MKKPIAGHSTVNFLGNVTHEGRLLERRASAQYVGSLCTAQDVHLPVIAVDGRVRTARRGKRAILLPAQGSVKSQEGDLPELLADHGMNVRITSKTERSFDTSSYSCSVSVSRLVLQAQQPVFIASGANLYINTPFSDADHDVLLDEFERLGVVSPEWRQMAADHGMGVVPAHLAGLKSQEVYPSGFMVAGL